MLRRKGTDAEHGKIELASSSAASSSPLSARWLFRLSCCAQKKERRKMCHCAWSVEVMPRSSEENGEKPFGSTCIFNILATCGSEEEALFCVFEFPPFSLPEFVSVISEGHSSREDCADEDEEKAVARASAGEWRRASIDMCPCA